MSDYRIQSCSWTDMDDLQSLTDNALRNSPLTNALLTNPPGSNRSNTVHTRHTLAHFTYLQALQAQFTPSSTSKVIKAINTRIPTPEMQACAWLQFYRPDTPDRIEEDVAGAPDCIDDETWKYIERIRHSTRKILMNENPHYFLKTLHFAPNIQGLNAAREILARINRMDTQHAILSFTKTEHESLYRELGWWDAGSVVFGPIGELAGRGGYGMRAFMRLGV